MRKKRDRYFVGDEVIATKGFGSEDQAKFLRGMTGVVVGTWEHTHEVYIVEYPVEIPLGHDGSIEKDNLTSGRLGIKKHCRNFPAEFLLPASSDHILEQTIEEAINEIKSGR